MNVARPYFSNPERLLISFIVFLTFQSVLFAQNSLELLVRDSLTSEKLVGVNVYFKGTTIGAVTDTNGFAHLNAIKAGPCEVVVSLIGYRKIEINIQFSNTPGIIRQEVMLPLESEELETVTVSASRNNSRIEDLPTKTEVLGRDDMMEENGIKPGNIASILGDIAGMQMQQTSATSGNINARMLGLSGRYSQILNDGMPMYGGFSGSFSILQIPPVDLKQIEIIKGSSSTLYGEGAIAGIINLVSKQPTDKKETSILINQTSLLETDMNTFISRRSKKAGITLFAGTILQKATDVNGDGFSDSPGIKNLRLHPRFFWYPGKNTTLTIGTEGILEERRGGDMELLKNGSSENHNYKVFHSSRRLIAEFKMESKFSTGSILTVKGSSSLLSRKIHTSNYNFEANQQLIFSEVSYLISHKSYDLVFGGNANADLFHPANSAFKPLPSYKYFTVGSFIQHDWRITRKALIETGLRYDYHSEFGNFLLPRLSVLYKINSALSARINGGLGYKVPVLLNYLDEETDLNRLANTDFSLKAETSRGVSIDLNYNGILWNSVALTLNQSVSYTLLNNPVVEDTSSFIRLYNAGKPVIAKGTQSFIRLSYKNTEFYISYVFTDVNKSFDSQHPYYYATPRHNLSATLAYETGGNWRFGLEGSLIGKQYIENYRSTPSYLFLAAMIQRNIGKFSIVLNCENLLDYRQKDYLIPPVSDPSFKILWATIDGRVINLSVNLKL